MARNPGSSCPSCGEPLVEGSPPHETVRRVVRPGARYGYPPATPGTVVEIEPRHLTEASALSCLYTVEEHGAAQDAERAKRNRDKPPSQLSAMVAASALASREQVKILIERGKANLEREARNADAEAVRARGVERELAEVRSPVSRDQEPSAAAALEVEGIPDRPEGSEHARAPESPRLRDRVLELHDGLWF